MSDRSKRAAKAGAIAALIFLGTCALLRSRQATPLPAPPPIATPDATTTSRETRAGRTPSPSPTTPVPPVIDSVTVEKDRVCEGEENLITVRAHTSDDNDAFLHYQVGATRGSPVALRSYLDDRGRPTAHRVSVFGKNNVATSVDVPSFRVERCDAAPVAIIEHRLRPNTIAEFDFDVHLSTTISRGVDGGAGISFRPRSFGWSWGDGTRDNTAGAHATHSFASRAQDTLYAHFLVTVEVVGDDGQLLKARHAIELLNPAFEAFAYKGVVLLFAELDPRFPVLSGSGVVDQGVRLWHARPDVVTITKVTVTTRRVDRGQRAAPAYPPVSSVLGAVEIPPGRRLEFHALLDTRAEPDTLSRDYALEGHAKSGHPVRGAFSVMKPPALPSKERHEPISDPVLLAKVRMAREVLQREYVTDEDLRALEREGRFEGLEVDARGPDSPLP